MNFNIMYLFLIGHFLGDFYFQTDDIAKNKNAKISSLIKHCLFYLFAMIIVIIPVFNLNLLLYSFFISLTHFIIDLIKPKKDNSVGIYFLDQFIHLIIILGISVYLSLNSNITYITLLKNVESLFSLDSLNCLAIILSVMVIMKPANITMKKVLSKYGNSVQEEKKGIPNTGALIGELERFIIFLMLTQGQYAAIGFILTAKSVARYKKIIDDVKFSEYYLLGTFLSTLIVILVYICIFLPI